MKTFLFALLAAAAARAIRDYGRRRFEDGPHRPVRLDRRARRGLRPLPRLRAGDVSEVGSGGSNVGASMSRRRWYYPRGGLFACTGLPIADAGTPVALIHVRDDEDEAGTRTHQMSARFLDIEIHDGELRLINIYDEEFRAPVDSLVTLEIR